ncbi:hypothetical protein H0H92_012996 [Tricholoma furcatifolium]|nr:hypothetical protein H0H92_012996 [Tricholoma furcatifolium]
MSYLREAAFNGLISTSRRRVAVLSLFLMFVLEVYILTTVEIKVLPSPQPFMTIWHLKIILHQWHDIFFNIRRIVFILLPLAVHFSPSIRIPFISGPTPPPKIDTSLLLVQSHQAISHLLPALHLLKYGQAAIMRVPDLRVRASSWWEEEAKVGAWIMEDGVQDSEGSTRQNVRGVARSLGTSFDESGDGVEEGKLRTNAKIMAKVLMIDALKPSPNWQQ